MRILSYSAIFVVLLVNLVPFSSCKADDDFGDEEFADESEQVIQTDAESSNEEYVAPDFVTPTLDKYSVHFVDWFDDLKGIGKRWLKSTAKKEGAEESIAKYNGEWAVGSPSNVVINNDYGLIVKTKARHHAIAASLNKNFRFEDKPLVVQYEVKYEEGQECGGGYAKLLSVDPKAAFHDKTPYTIMFGPDKCGMTAKVHFIIRLKNPKNGTVSEYHAKQPTRSLAPFFEDKKTHLYTLIVKPNNDFQVLVDNAEIMSGNLLTDLEPSVVPPKQIHDPDDKKPEDWDDREFVVDPDAKKPDDWDEDAPKEIVDPDAKKPDDWLEEEEPLIPDLNAKKPDDWDENMDGTWEAPKISNPKCEGISGCGKWTAPMKQNPLYKGKWTPPKVQNPAYKGKWSPKLIDNPHYFEADPFKMLDPIGAIGFELWTMSSGIVFDNIIIADDIDRVREFARQTFNIKVDQEKLFDAIANPSNIQNFWTSIKQAIEDKPWLWAVVALVILVPLILLSIFCFGKKSASSASHPKKTDEPQPDEEVDEEMEDPVEEVQPGGTPVVQELPGASQNADEEESVDNNQESKRSRSRTRGSQSSEGSEEQTQQETQQKEPESPSKPTRRTRIRRED